MSDRRVFSDQQDMSLAGVLLELLLGLGGLVMLVELLRLTGFATAILHVSALVYLVMSVLIVSFWRAHACGLGWANRVTLARGVLIVLLTGTLVLPGFIDDHPLVIFSLALVALMLDGVDGMVARHTGSGSRFGARFDMELDAFFILVLCLMLMLQDKAGYWVIIIGAMRYLFIVASWVWPWLSADLPVSYRRKAVCVWQVSTLMVCLMPWIMPPWSSLLLMLALALLALSFGIDIVRLRKPLA